MNPVPVQFDSGTSRGPVSGLLVQPERAVALYVLAHGAGAGMRHRFMESMAETLARREIATLRYQFPYMEQRSGRPDPPPILHATVRAAVRKASELAPGLPLLAGGKSMGGRMTSAAASESPLPGVRGLVFLGFPLHQAGKPGTSRAEHLGRVPVPMLFLQGTRDALADLGLIREVTGALPLARLHVVLEADHSFAVLKRSGRTASEVLDELADAVRRFADGLVSEGPK